MRIDGSDKREYHFEDSELRFDVVTSGLHTETWVRITHIPTGTQAEATHKNQLKAKRIALDELAAKLEADDENRNA